MTTIRQIFSLILVFIIFGCTAKKQIETESNQDTKEWNKIKNSSDFATFFNFALNVADTALFNKSIDSLEETTPTNSNDVLHYIEHYVEESDSMAKTIALEDLSGKCVCYRERNMLIIITNKYDSIKAYYNQSLLEDYRNELYNIFESNEISLNFPGVSTITYDGKEYLSRRLGVFIYTSLYSDSLETKDSWKDIIYVVKDIEKTIEISREKKSNKLFNIEYNKLNKKRKNLIDRLVPLVINIYIDRPLLFLPPPMPNKEDLKTNF